MAENTLAINATSQRGDRSQRSVTCTSDSADRDKMLTLARAINGLTTNNFVDAKHIQKVDLDDDPDGGYKPGAGYDVIGLPEAVIDPDESKTTPTITLATTTITATALRTAIGDNYYYDVPVTYDGNGMLYAVQKIHDGAKGAPSGTTFGSIIDDNGTKKLRLALCEYYKTSSSITGTITVRSTATDTCNQASATFTVT